MSSVSDKGPLRKFAGFVSYQGMGYQLLECGHAYVPGCQGKRKAMRCVQCAAGMPTHAERTAEWDRLKAEADAKAAAAKRIEELHARARASALRTADAILRGVPVNGSDIETFAVNVQAALDKQAIIDRPDLDYRIGALVPFVG